MTEQDLQRDGTAVSYETVKVEIDGWSATITIDREPRMNALYGLVYDDLESALDLVEGEPDVRVVVLTGAGDRAFCAGGDKDLDIGGLGHQTPEDAIQENDRGQSVVRRLRRLRRPVVARVNGVAVGGGLDLVLACDLVVAADHARFGSAWIRRGIAPAYGGAWQLPRIVGQKRAADLLLTGRLMAADEALAMGLVSRVVPLADLDATVGEVVDAIAELSPLAVDLTKRLIREGAETGFDAQLETASLAVHTLSQTADHHADAARATAGDFGGSRS